MTTDERSGTEVGSPPESPATGDAADPPAQGTVPSPGTAAGDPSPGEPSVREIAARLGWTSVLAVAWALLPAMLGFLLLANMGWASEWLDRAEPYDELVYAGFFAATAGLGLLPTYAQALFGGYSFALLPGVPLALLGFVGASLIGYALARTVARDRVAREIERWPKAEVVRRAFVGRGPARTLLTVALVRLPFNSPFALTNLVLASLRISPVIYVVGTAAGMLPRTAAVVWIGSQISDWASKERPGWYLPASIGLSVAVLLVLSQIGKSALERAASSGPGGPRGGLPDPPPAPPATAPPATAPPTVPASDTLAG